MIGSIQRKETSKKDGIVLSGFVDISDYGSIINDSGKGGSSLVGEQWQ